VADLPEIVPLTTAAIWSGWEREQDRSRRTYVGASVLGDECERKLWYSFRWAHEPEVFDGRKLRLFNTGHVEEDRLIADLRRAGIDVLDRDPQTGGQLAVTFAWGHGGGHMDGVAYGVPEAPKTDHVLEAKTHNHKSFTALKRLGVAGHKPVHMAQMQVYMHLHGTTRALYLAVNKNDDEIYTERVEYDPALSLSLMVKAERIIASPVPPTKAHEDPESKMAWGCQFCPALSLCHLGAMPLRSCRTCLHATPEQDGDGRWSCDRHKRDLSREDQEAGCPNHLFIPALIPGEQDDADEAGEWVSYRMADGSVWRDGGGA
jgi:hypothetical protein